MSSEMDIFHFPAKGSGDERIAIKLFENLII